MATTFIKVFIPTAVVSTILFVFGIYLGAGIAMSSSGSSNPYALFYFLLSILMMVSPLVIFPIGTYVYYGQLEKYNLSQKGKLLRSVFFLSSFVTPFLVLSLVFWIIRFIWIF